MLARRYRLVKKPRTRQFVVGVLVVVGLGILTWIGQPGIVCRFPPERTAATDVRMLRAAVVLWQVRHPAPACPSIAQLVEERDLDPGVGTNDPWGNPYDIRCDGETISVASLGPDGVAGTGDDVSRSVSIGR